MIDYSKELVSALETVLPTYYELALTKDSKVPCISYQERNNADTNTGNTLGYSRISYTVKVWANSIAIIQKYVLEVDRALKALGFRRIAANELHDPQSTMIQKILTYECLALEQF